MILLYNISSDAFSFSELIDRQISYISAWREFSPESFQPPLIIVSGVGDENSPSSDLCEVVSLSKSNLNPVTFLYLAFLKLKHLKSSGNSFFFIAGSPLQPLAICVMLKRLFRGSRLQVSLHNDLGAWFAPGLLNLLKRNFFRSQTKQIDLFRFVSEVQFSAAKTHFDLRKRVSVVCPIPIYVPDSTPNSREIQNPVLGFVGRVHEERGVEEWIEISKQLKEFQPYIVGDGPLLEVIKTALPHATFAGKLSHKQSLETYERFSVLLSCAPFESYGLSIREALLSNIPVVTKNTVGARELLELFPGIIRSYENVEEAVYLIRQLSNSQDVVGFQYFREWLLRNRKNSLQSLVSHWG